MQQVSHHLTSREWTVAGLVAQGKTNKQISFYLGTSPLTVRNQVCSILRKIGATSRLEIASFATHNALKHRKCLVDDCLEYQDASNLPIGQK